MDTIHNHVNWSTLARAVTYQVRTPTGWTTISAALYRTIQNPDNRRILMRETKTINNQTLAPVP